MEEKVGKKSLKTSKYILDATQKYRDNIKNNKDERFYNRLKYFKEYYRSHKPKSEKDKLLEEALDKLKKYKKIY